MNYPDIRLHAREYEKRTSHLRHRKYEKTKPGFLMRLYRNMKIRVLGRDKKKRHLFVGLELVSKYEFYEWAATSAEFNEMFDAWQRSGFSRQLTPTLLRIDTTIGYVLSNIEWTRKGDIK